ncbi:hypothetical protein GX50_06048 [[Emmonsia] crescens]|uniref:RlpA-like protein double-psi beta-barrel domain-containing protein n=1 Tax=[Emmonsia] crescens TaxID=73230 RepID=A0A2B7ZD91_9EURO|nr:hypothetical protein GX50_06048 [Emmonsia crescens]
MIFIPCLMTLAIIPGLVFATPVSSPGGILLPRSQALQPGELITDALARLHQPPQRHPNQTTASSSSSCTFNHKYNSSSSSPDPTASLAYINPALLYAGKGNGNGTGLCGTPIIVINPFLNNAIAATVAGGCGNCSMYDVELSEAAWGKLTGAGAGGGGKEKLEGLKPGSVWKDGRERVGVAVQWMISPVQQRQQRQPDDSRNQNPNPNPTQTPNKVRKGRVPIPPGINQVQRWAS